MVADNLSVPLRRMARFFLTETLPPVQTVRDVYESARVLRERGIAPTLGEERLLRQIVWCMLHVEDGDTTSELQRALARLASLVLAIVEDDDLEIPDDRQIAGRAALESLALEINSDSQQLEMQIGATIGLRSLNVSCAADLEEHGKTIAPDERDPQVERVLQRAAIHLRQGETLLAQQKDPRKAASHRERHAAACTRVMYLLARLLAIPAAGEPPVVRKNLVRRELKRIEVDALGIERLSSEEQIREAAKLLAWTAVDLGETATPENRARLATELRRAASMDESESSPEPAAEEDGSWLFGTGE